MQQPIIACQGQYNVYLLTRLPLSRKGHSEKQAAFNTSTEQITQLNVTTGFPRYGALVALAT